MLVFMVFCPFSFDLLVRATRELRPRIFRVGYCQLGPSHLLSVPIGCPINVPIRLEEALRPAKDITSFLGAKT